MSNNNDFDKMLQSLLHDEAKRTAGDIIADTANIKRHISDYELCQIAEVDIKFIDYLDNINKPE